METLRTTQRERCGVLIIEDGKLKPYIVQSGTTVSNDISDDLMEGRVVQIGKKLYIRCRTCGCIICVNKFIFGSLHFCK